MRVLCLGLVLACVSPVFCATSTAWQINGYSDLAKGKLTGLSLTADGLLRPGVVPAYTTELGQPAGWAMVRAAGGLTYVSTGHSGKVFQVESSGKSTLLWSAPQSEVFALCLVAGGSLYAGTSPNGSVYRLTGGKPTEVWHSPEKYIWSLVSAPDGSLYVGTGDKGRIYRVQADGTSSIYYETGQANVTALVLDHAGKLLAGTDPNGLLYEITGAGAARVLYDSNLPEISSIVVGARGEIYAAAMGGAVSTRSLSTPASFSSGSTGVVTATTPTVVTVTEASEGQGIAAGATTAQPSAVSTSTASSQASSVTELNGVDRSAVYLISPNGAVETLRTSKEDNVYDLALAGTSLLLATDNKGRIYKMDGHRQTLMAELPDSTITSLLSGADGIVALQSNPARIVDLRQMPTDRRSFESPVHDASSVARWGQLQWHGSGADIQFETRTGYSARPDGTWGSWTAIDKQSNRILSAAGRFIQLKALWPAGSTAALDGIDVPYLARNGAPAIRSLSVISVANSAATKTSATTATTSSAPYSITVTDTGEAPAASSATSGSQNISRQQSTQMQVSWQADDPDGDKLAYSLYFRAEDGNEWQPIRTHIFENSVLLDTDVLADGRYLFRVTATDSPANAKELAQSAEFFSTPVLIDNTPPSVTLGAARRTALVLDLPFEAADKTSALRLCEYSVDAGPWQPVEADDGVTDSPHESFHLHLSDLTAGEHLVVVRAYDAANNIGLAKLVVH